MWGIAIFGSSILFGEWNLEILFFSSSPFYEHTEPSVSVEFVSVRCGIALDAWMFPLDDEIFPRVKQPIFFINSEKFQWAGNISRMKKLDSTVIEENDHHQVRSETGEAVGKRTRTWNRFWFSSGARCTRAFQTSPSWRGTASGSCWSLRERSTQNLP